ncbi:MAG: metal-dependent hydrolase, partial [Perlucidibaca sp.]
MLAVNAITRLTGSQVGIPPRHMNFSFPSEAGRYFAFDGNPLASLLFVVFSGIFPPGERFFMASVRHFRDRINHPVLQAQISGFMGQEALHGREHEKLNDFFRARGMDVDTAERHIRFSLNLLERLPPRLQLACTTLMEHFTAHLAEQWLCHEEFARTSDPEMLKLWYWHAVEELEHKSVAYDVFEQVGGTLGERRLAVVCVAAALLLPVLASWGVLLVREGQV